VLATTYSHQSRIAKPLFFLLCLGGEKKGLVNIAWHCCSGSQQILGRLLVKHKGLLIGVDRSRTLNLWHKECEWLVILWARSIYTNQQAIVLNQKPLKIIPKSVNCQNSAMLCLPDPFPPPTHKRKKQSSYARLYSHLKCTCLRLITSRKSRIDWVEACTEKR